MIRWAWIVFLAVGLLACKPKTFPGTKIPDNDENRAVLRVVGEYQRNMEARDLDALVALASPDYYEDRGTPQDDDDYGIQELRSALAADFANIQQMRYSVEVKNITIEGNKAFVDFHFEMAFQFKIGDTARWHTAEQDNQLELVKIDNDWKIRAGL